MATKIKPQVGTLVTYVSTKGYIKPALIVNVQDTVVPGHALPELENDTDVHLLVFATNGTSPRFNVKHESSKISPENVGTEDDAAPQGYWR